MKPKNERYTVAVDFDGVIHSYTSPWVNAETIPDPPVPGAIEWLWEMSKRFEIVIFSTRCKTGEGRQAVQRWLFENCERSAPLDADPSSLPLRLKYTADKPPALVYLDDRAMRFEGVFPTAEEIHAARPWNKR